jgi:hypothetical protein
LTVSRFFLQESGFISAADNGIKDLLLNADYRVWQHATCLLKKAKLMPGGCFTLELTSTAPPCDAINTMEEIKKSRDEKFGVRADANKALFDEIVSQRSGAVIPGFSVHRFVSINGCGLRSAGMMQTWKGKESIAARVTVRHTASGTESTAILKWSMSDSAKADASLNHERKVLKHLHEVPGVVDLFQNSDLVSKTIKKNMLVMQEAYSHHSNFEILSVGGLTRLVQRSALILNELHSRELCQNNVSTRTLRYNTINECVCLTSMQYVSLIASASDHAKRLAASAGIEAPPKAPPSRNLPWFDQQILSAKTDSLLLGSTILSCMMRNSEFFLTRGAIELSKLGDGSDLTLARLIVEAVSEFNRHIAEGDPRLQMQAGVVEVVQGLLCKDPDARISCLVACQMLAALRVPQQPRVQTLQVPAGYCELLGEMHRPYEIFTTTCMDQKGNAIDGYGLRAIGKGLPGDLICPYLGTCVDKLHADILNACDKGHSTKNLGDLYLVGGLDEGTIRSLYWLVENGAGSLANCNTTVTTEEDGSGDPYSVLEPTQATAYFDVVSFSCPRKLPIPGDVWADSVFVLRVATQVSDGEEYRVSYGTGTTRNMFVSPGREYVVRKRTKHNQTKV